MRVLMCAHVCGSEISTFSAVSQAQSVLFLETRSLIDLELTKQARLGSR